MYGTPWCITQGTGATKTAGRVCMSAPISTGRAGSISTPALMPNLRSGTRSGGCSIPATHTAVTRMRNAPMWSDGLRTLRWGCGSEGSGSPYEPSGRSLIVAAALISTVLCRPICLASPDARSAHSPAGGRCTAHCRGSVRSCHSDSSRPPC